MRLRSCHAESNIGVSVALRYTQDGEAPQGLRSMFAAKAPAFRIGDLAWPNLVSSGFITA